MKTFAQFKQQLNEAREPMYHSIFWKPKEGGKWSHHFDADDKEDARLETDGMRRNGEKVAVLRVPKSQANWNKLGGDGIHEYVESRLKNQARKSLGAGVLDRPEHPDASGMKKLGLNEGKTFRKEKTDKPARREEKRQNKKVNLEEGTKLSPEQHTAIMNHIHDLHKEHPAVITKDDLVSSDAAMNAMGTMGMRHAMKKAGLPPCDNCHPRSLTEAWMNDYDIHNALQRHANHPALSKAAKIIAHVADEANSHSDGWHSWPAPSKAASKMQELVQKADPNTTMAHVKKAFAPIASFYTRRGDAAGMQRPPKDLLEGILLSEGEVPRHGYNYSKAQQWKDEAAEHPEGSFEHHAALFLHHKLMGHYHSQAIDFGGDEGHHANKMHEHASEELRHHGKMDSAAGDESLRIFQMSEGKTVRAEKTDKKPRREEKREGNKKYLEEGYSTSPINFFSPNIKVHPHTATHAKHLNPITIGKFAEGQRVKLDRVHETGEYIAQRDDGAFIHGPEVK